MFSFKDRLSSVDVFNQDVSRLSRGRIIKGNDESDVIEGNGQVDRVERGLVPVLCVQPLREIYIGLRKVDS
jgi:hypothetical protein